MRSSPTVRALSRPLVLALLASLCACASTREPHAASARSASSERAPAPIHPDPMSTASTALRYPAARRTDTVDTHHGVRVADPYRWLEDTDAPETRAWIAAQNELTESVLAQVPERARLRTRLSELWNHPRQGLPARREAIEYYTANDGLQNQSPLYARKLGPGGGGTPELVLDPNTLSSDGTVALIDWSVSEDGSLVACALSDGGSDWRTWTVYRASGEKLPDDVRWSKFSSAHWASDGSGFFYTRFDEPRAGDALSERNSSPQLCFHRLGTPQSEDAVHYVLDEDPALFLNFDLSEDGSTLILSKWDSRTRNNELWFKSAADPAAPLQPLVTGFDAQYDAIAKVGGEVLVKTTLGAPRWRVVAIELAQPERARWRELVPQAEQPIEGAYALAGHLWVQRLADAQSRVLVHRIDGSLAHELHLPGIGSVQGLSGRFADPVVHYAFAGFTRPTAIYRCTAESPAAELAFAPPLSFDPSRYETRQVFYASKDGTRVPMFLVHRKGIRLDGSNPTFLYGYGGFNVSLTPSFSASVLAWLELGGIYAVPNLRGGGEYGEEWHTAGTKLRKQNVFDDFIAAARWLIESGHTRPDKLAISGGSNGGLLVGACMLQEPALFGACLPAVGVMDMLRFHKFTIGWAWVADYGSAEDAEQFRALLAYSPVHNTRAGTAYPPTLITTGDHDDRVVPGHSFKFAAALQAAQGGPAPILIRIDTRAGHGAGKSLDMLIDEAADRWAFVIHSLGLSTAQARP
jgi:prolyl oligopeptidase